MKKIIYSLAVLFACSCAFISCGDDDDSTTFSTTPEKESAGIYSGTWTVTLDNESYSGVGSITLEATNTVYQTNVTFSSQLENSSLNVSETSIANITHAGKGYIFNNNTDSNPLGSGFSGKIDDSGNMYVNFQKQVKVGRKQYIYTYVFAGKKN